MAGVTKEQIARAKEWDLLPYLQSYEPQELRKCGQTEYRTVTHDSLKISNGKWHWHSRGIGGRTALDYMVKVRGMDFVSAVETLCMDRCVVDNPPPLSRGKDYNELLQKKAAEIQTEKALEKMNKDMEK